jgi:hypothetical protein
VHEHVLAVGTGDEAVALVRVEPPCLSRRKC